MTVRTRFAPSPTGNLHVGSVRAALYAWLYAKHQNGQFILRIEDTDRVRSTDASTQIILDAMNWLGLEADEGPIFQKDRLARYKEKIETLLNEGKAYRCYCSKTRLNELREAQMQAKEKPKYDACCREKQLPHRDEPYVVRFKTPQEGEVTFHDEVYGSITVNNQELDDLVIQKGDGFPTYNLAVVVDDWDMGITHVIRGDDHINNTPRQIHLFQAFKAPLPIFAHLPMILGDDGKKLSKRHGAVSVLEFKEAGYLPEALLNYLVRLGWSHGDQEIFSLNEMISLFDFASVNPGTASFNYDKLTWLNQHYLKSLPAEHLVALLKPLYQEAGISLEKGPELTLVVPLMVERASSLNEIVDKTHYFYQDEISYDEKAVKKHLKASLKTALAAVLEEFREIQDWASEPIHQVITDVAERFELKMGKVAQPIRVSVTGSTMSPSIDITLKLIGKERVLSRIAHVLSDLMPSE